MVAASSVNNGWYLDGYTTLLINVDIPSQVDIDAGR